jgi:hypothetical protein
MAISLPHLPSGVITLKAGGAEDFADDQDFDTMPATLDGAASFPRCSLRALRCEYSQECCQANENDPQRDLRGPFSFLVNGNRKLISCRLAAQWSVFSCRRQRQSRPSIFQDRAIGGSSAAVAATNVGQRPTLMFPIDR